MVAYDSNGNWGSYVTLSDSSQVRIGAGNTDKLVIRSNGIDAYDQLRMNDQNITGLRSGQISATSTDAVNGSQLYSTNTNVTNLSNTVNNSASVKYFKANTTAADAQAMSSGSIAIGGNALVENGTNGFAIGAGATVKGTATADANEGLALGLNSNVSAGGGAMALGSQASATAGGAVALGRLSVADRADTVSVGSSSIKRQITNVAAGTQDTDAVNMAQLKSAGLNVDTSGNVTNSFVAYDDATKGKVTLAGGANGTTITNLKAGAVNAASTDAINGSQLYSVSESVAQAIGGGSTVNADGTISGPSYTVDGTTVHNIGDAITNIDERTTINSTAISNINETLNNITESGAGIKFFHANSVLADSQAIGVNAVAIGGNARAQADNSVALGSNSVADRANSVSVGAAGAERQITNVAAGTVDTDAVNLGQLKAAGLINADGSANAAATYDHNADGSINYNSMTMGDNVAGGTTIHNVAAGTDSMDAVNVNQMNEAIANVTTIANNSANPLLAANGNRETEVAVASGNHSTAMGANAKASAENSVALGANSVADRANTVSVGAAGSERQIVNVAAGTEATDAVNVEQMNAAVDHAIGSMPAGMTAKDYTDSRVNTLQSTVNQVAKNSYAGIAAAMAMPNLTPSQPGKTVVAAGSGVYKSGAAAAVGVTHRSRNGKWLTNGALSVTSTGDAGARVQLGYEF